MSIFVTDKAQEYLDIVNKKSDKYKILAMVTVDVKSSHYTDCNKTIYLFDNGTVLEYLFEHDDIPGHKETNQSYRLLN
jgi:hypothetical protein